MARSTAMDPSVIVSLLIAALGGAAVGLERQWSGHAQGPGARFAGLRTFTMLGALGGLSGWLWQAGVSTPAALVLAGAVAIVAAAYWAGSRQDIDGTTEVAALVVLATGVLAGIGSVRLASAIIAITTLLLVEKSRLHALASRIDDVGMRSAIRFAVMALVILPLLPSGPYGPLGGIKPRELWTLVLAFSGLSFTGFAAQRLLGAGPGYAATGLLGGIVSSTNVTFTFARLSRLHTGSGDDLARGAVAANAVVYPRVLIATALLSPRVAGLLAVYLLLPGVVAAGLGVAGFRRVGSTGGSEVPQRNPLQMLAALQLAGLFQLVLFVVHAARTVAGVSGVLMTAVVVGLTDVDALTVSMARDVAPAVSPATAAMGVAIGVAANTLTKLGLAVSLGSPGFRKTVGGALTLILLVQAAGMAAVALGVLSRE